MGKIRYFLQMLLKIFFKFYFLKAYRVKYVFRDFEPKREGPFFMIGNHVLLLDPFFVCFPIKGYAIPVTNAFVYTNVWRRLGLTIVVDSIGKRKGQSDIQTIRNIKRFVSKGNKISIYPEGNTSYYGETGESIYSTAKLFKMQKIDVVCSVTKGGYFAKPRWRKTKTKRPYVEIEMFTLFTKEEIAALSVEEIFDKMTEALKHNDYEWNKVNKIEYKGKNRLQGVHRVIYGCPECNSINNIKSSGDAILCEKCNALGTINDYGFIDGSKFDNFVEWGAFQEELLKTKLKLDTYEFDTLFSKVDLINFTSENFGSAKLIYSKGIFTVKTKDFEMKFEIAKITGAVFTESTQFSFDYNNETFMFITEKPKLLLDITKYIKED